MQTDATTTIATPAQRRGPGVRPRVSASGVDRLRACPHRYREERERWPRDEQPSMGEFADAGTAFHAFAEPYVRALADASRSGVELDTADLAERTLADVEAEHRAACGGMWPDVVAWCQTFADDYALPPAERWYFELQWAIGSDGRAFAVGADEKPPADAIATGYIDVMWLQRDGKRLIARVRDYKTSKSQLAEGRDAKTPQYAKRTPADVDKDVKLGRRMPKDRQLRWYLLAARDILGELVDEIRIGHYYPRTGHWCETGPITPADVDAGCVREEILAEHAELRRRIDEADWPATQSDECKWCPFAPPEAAADNARACGDDSCPAFRAERAAARALLDEPAAAPLASQQSAPQAAPQPENPEPDPVAPAPAKTMTTTTHNNGAAAAAAETQIATLLRDEPDATLRDLSDTATAQRRWPDLPAERAAQLAAGARLTLATAEANGIDPDDIAVSGDDDAGAAVDLDAAADAGWEQAGAPGTAFVKLFIFGDTGTGKTRGALNAFATPAGTPPRVALIDTEDGARHYGREWSFLRRATTDPDIVAATVAAPPEGIDALVIDSFSLYCESVFSKWAARFLLRETRSQGNKREYYTLQPRDYVHPQREIQQTIKALLGAPYHVVVTAQAKAEYAEGDMMRKIGVTFDAFKRTPYFFDSVILLEPDAATPGKVWATTKKDRTGLLPQGRWEYTPARLAELLGVAPAPAAAAAAPAPVPVPAQQMLPGLPGKTDYSPREERPGDAALRHANSNGAIGTPAAAAAPARATDAQLSKIKELKAHRCKTDVAYRAALAAVAPAGVTSAKELTPAQADALIAELDAIVPFDNAPAPATAPVPAAAPAARQADAVWQGALGDIDAALAAAEGIPERGSDFRDSVTEKLDSIYSTISERQHVTDKQLEAIANMRGGIDRWLQH